MRKLRWVLAVVSSLFVACVSLVGYVWWEREIPGWLLAPAVKLFLRVPPGFHVQIFAAGIPNARSMARGPRGTLFVGTRVLGRVYAVVDRDQDGQADQITVIARGLNTPNGVAFRDGALYVAEASRILRFDDIENRLEDPPKPVVVNDGFPTDPEHASKFIAFGPDGWLYVPVGAPCNICERADERYASIMRLHPDGTGLEIYARGVRNTLGFDWHPITGDLWFTENGRDELGDNLPPDELNSAPRSGMNFGFPYCHGRGISDPVYGGKRSCSSFVPPIAGLGAHVAALGMIFYTGAMFPPAYRNQILVAEHGSWNRTTPVGYRVELVRLEGDRVIGEETFASGWLLWRYKWGRPAEMVVLPDGSLLVSDDYAGAIYRITFRR